MSVYVDSVRPFSRYHLLAYGECFEPSDHAAARSHVRRRLALDMGRPPHEIEIDALIIRCPMGDHRSTAHNPRYRRTA